MCLAARVPLRGAKSHKAFRRYGGFSPEGTGYYLSNKALGAVRRK